MIKLQFLCERGKIGFIMEQTQVFPENDASVGQVDDEIRVQCEPALARDIQSERFFVDK